MIEAALRRQLEPIAHRRRRLDLAWQLSIGWLACGLVGLTLLGAGRLWGWRSPAAFGVLGAAAIVATLWIVGRSYRRQPDYHALARKIEQQHPDLKALLLAALEQKPASPDGQFGYLQRQVLLQAVAAAGDHDWLRSVSTKALVLASLARLAALSLLLFTLLPLWPGRLGSGISPETRVLHGGYSVIVTPGDTEVEQGSPVVILARFEGRVPSAVSLQFGPPGQSVQRLALTKSLDDPVFGGIIQDISTDLLYRVEYANKRTRDYRISVYQSPELVRADARITYPAYTKLPEKIVEDTRQISVVEGSEVVLTFTLNKPVATARLAPRTGIAPQLAVDPAYPNVLTASLTARASEQYELRLADAQGRPNKLPPRFGIDVQKNLLPELTPVFPGNDVAVSPLEELALEAKVADDFGLTGYGLTYNLAGTQGRDIKLGEGEPSGQEPQIHYLLALEGLGAQPDQLVTYYFWADDIGPDGKARRTASDIYFAEVRPFEEIFRESQSFQDRQNQDQQESQGNQQGGQGEQLARLQKQLISATWNVKQQAERSGGMEGHKEDLDVVRQSQGSVLEQARTALTQAEDPAAAKSLQAAAGHMETAVNHLTQASEAASTGELMPALGAEQSAYQELLKLRQREHQIAMSRNAGRANNANSERFQQQLQQLELTQRENRYETQRLAQSRQQNGQRQDLRMLNRLRDLARRQSEMSDKLREAEAALRQARNEQERQDALRELRRLRDEQLQALRDTDEVGQQMENSQNRRRLADARQRLDDSRSQIRQSAEALEQGMVSRAITSATRAQRQLEQMREDLQRRTSSRFADQMRDMRDEAQQLDERQNQIAEGIGQQVDSKQKTLTGSETSRELADQIDRQKESMKKLLEQMKEVSEQAEPSEPLLSQKLYDTLRKASTGNVDKALEATGELLRRNFLPQAREIERRAGEGIDQLRQGVEEAAQNVLGDEAESLRLARQQLDELIKQARGESARAAGEQRAENGQRNPEDRGQRAEDSTGSNPQSAIRNPQLNTPEQAQEGGSSGQGTQRQPADRAQAEGRGRDDPQRRGTDRLAQDSELGPEGPDQRGGTGPRGPFTDENYRDWSDRLRDVQEMLPQQDLRDEVARVWDQARAIRAEFKRHGKEPQWDLLRTEVIEPLAELRQHVSARLAQLESKEAMVPIDRDPVPDRFTELVRTYFENLGRGGQ